MALRFNGTEITKLLYNGMEQNALKFNNIGCFGKRFSLTQNPSTGVTFSISRSSSPNQQAGTGNIGTGNTIYYGDVVIISVSPITNYTNAKLYVDIGNGQGVVQRTSPFTFTVNSNVIFYGTASAAEVWQTVWTGTQTFNSSGSFTVPGLAAGGQVQVTASATFLQQVVDWDGVTYPEYDYSLSGSITRKILPTEIWGSTASIDVSRNGGQILFTFNQSIEYAKGFDIHENPVSITITEVRRSS